MGTSEPIEIEPFIIAPSKTVKEIYIFKVDKKMKGGDVFLPFLISHGACF